MDPYGNFFSFNIGVQNSFFSQPVIQVGLIKSHSSIDIPLQIIVDKTLNS